MIESIVKDILFLPINYLVVLFLTGVIVGWVFPSRQRHVRVALFLFTLYMLPQIIFRFTEDAQPIRAIGQYIYYALFSVIALVIQYVKERNNLQRKNGNRTTYGR